MFGYLFPKGAIFFDQLDRHASLARQAAIKFQESLFEEINIQRLKQIKSLEHEADQITKLTSEKLHKTFITPIDRDQIYHLISKLDDVIDSIDATADCLIIYKITDRQKSWSIWPVSLSWLFPKCRKLSMD